MFIRARSGSVFRQARRRKRPLHKSRCERCDHAPKGKVAGQEYSREIAINLPEAEAADDSLASLWARTRVNELSNEKLRGANPSKTADFDKQITQLGLEFRLMTNFTSFVAVEDRARRIGMANL